jgi:uncharacterized protein RhaS with RHS repeats
MGVRLYAPAIGRFLSTDPVYGGNANTYTYPADPINTYDLDGRATAPIERGSRVVQVKIPPRVISQIRRTGWDCGSRRGCYSAPGPSAKEIRAACRTSHMGGMGAWTAGFGAALGGTEQGKKFLLKIVGKVATRAVPVAGWGLMAVDGVCTLAGA